MTTAIHDVATMLHMLQYLKEKVPPHQWADTPLPVLAAPRSWLQQLGQELGVADDAEPDTVHGCSVVCMDELDAPALIDHDGKVYPIPRGWATQADGPQPRGPLIIQ